MQDAGKIITELFYSFLKTSQNFEERICGRIVFDKVVGCKPSDCITQKWHSNRCFPWNIAKLFKATTFFMKHPGDSFWNKETNYHLTVDSLRSNNSFMRLDFPLIVVVYPL